MEAKEKQREKERYAADAELLANAANKQGYAAKKALQEEKEVRERLTRIEMKKK